MFKQASLRAVGLSLTRANRHTCAAAQASELRQAHQAVGEPGDPLVSSAAMPLKKRPYVASADQVRVTREGDYAVIEYADDTVATTHLKMGADKLASMTDEELLDFWNDHIEAREDDRQRLRYTATEIPVGKPQVEFFEEGKVTVHGPYERGFGWQ